ncbi:glycosyltransferase [Phaeobacter marinintestinus]|uniref:glycosyltransferase n=1 Tax=Falsiphaeobacter marinintestinus TaxID=1492905 RepID=UPI0011B35932|nr:glycosyltransferase [Phaeobacter marinintestinus]
MSDQNLRLISPDLAIQPALPRRPLGRVLVDNGEISQDQLIKALKLQKRQQALLGEILCAQGWSNSNAIDVALAEQHGLQKISLAADAPQPGLIDLKPVSFWIQHGVLPWARISSVLMIATSRPDQFDAVKAALAGSADVIVPVLADDTDIARCTARLFRDTLAQGANTRVPERFSCRTWTLENRLPLALVACLGILLAILAPLSSLTIATAAAVLTMLLFTGLKLAGLLGHMLDSVYLNAHGSPKVAQTEVRLPKVSMLVPLYHEREIAGALVNRLTRLTYPKELLEVLLVLEEHDDITRQTLSKTDLPHWMRVIEVPAHGGLTTKPRAMNYALDFCKGEIVGVWDAEDAPVPDQIERVVHRFAQAGDTVACLQGILDFYNPRTNWRARCFTIEYSSWFRIVLPGIARLGLVVPLGGTTLFFRRRTLVKLGGWDAHNVTEDADLGVRLCRAGYRTELIDTVTYEEANCRAWPWVKQRSRWLKGFMVTYLVHMRNPLQLLRDLGPWRFFGFQAFFLGTLGQFLLAPLLWTMWLMAFGVWHPVQSAVPTGLLSISVGLFVTVEILSNAIGMAAVSTAQRRFLIPWVPTMMFYLPLGVLAGYKALYELVFIPFYWDKTQHGQAEEDPSVS